MQKVTLLLFMNVFFMSCAFADLKSTNESDELGVVQLDPETAGSQKRIVELLERDILFEREKRQLSNEVALEKLRAELRKIRSDSNSATAMTETSAEDAGVITKITNIPQVLAVSQVAGITKIAVSVGNRIMLIGRFETFDVDGKKYRLYTDSKNKLFARVVNP